MPSNGDIRTEEKIISVSEARGILSSKSGAERDRIRDLIMDFDNGRIKTLKLVTTYKYRNAGQNSGWYIDKTTVIGI